MQQYNPPKQFAFDSLPEEQVVSQELTGTLSGSPVQSRLSVNTRQAKRQLNKNVSRVNNRAGAQTQM